MRRARAKWLGVRAYCTWHCNPVITQGEWRYLFLGARRVIVFNLAGTLHAIDDDCANHGASLFAGKRDGAMGR